MTEEYLPIVKLVYRADCTPRDVLRCFYGLSSTDLNAFMTLLKLRDEGWVPAEKYAEFVDLSPSSAQRLLRKLITLGLANRQKVKGDKNQRPYRYEYKATSILEIITRLNQVLTDMNSKLGKFLEDPTLWENAFFQNLEF
ncbi:MAG: helix-turn-helix domain-containing protein [Candidatus Hodarchaeota archaeon]